VRGEPTNKRQHRAKSSDALAWNSHILVLHFFAFINSAYSAFF